MADSNQITEHLRRISDTLIINASFSDNIGLLNGKTGIALFFFHLARTSGIDVYKEYASDLVDQVCESLHRDMLAGYADGLAGIGVGIEYMIKQEFIDADADEILEDVDSAVLHHTLYHLPSTPEISAGITGFGKYYTERLSNRTYIPDDAPKKTYLSEITKALSCPYNTYGELLSVIHFLSGTVPLGIAAEKGNAYLNYAVDKMETMAYEDVHFGVFPNGGFHPLTVAATLVQASETTGNRAYFDKAQQYLQLYEPGFRPHLKNETQTDTLKWSFLYQCLGKKFKDSSLLQLSEEWLNNTLTKESGHHTSMGLLDGHAGAGMYLLSLNGQCNENWMDIVPCYL